jgi:hypothetical protein
MSMRNDLLQDLEDVSVGHHLEITDGFVTKLSTVPGN